jgi:hypothetical protein
MGIRVGHGKWHCQMGREYLVKKKCTGKGGKIYLLCVRVRARMFSEAVSVDVCKGFSFIKFDSMFGFGRMFVYH